MYFDINSNLEKALKDVFKSETFDSLSSNSCDNSLCFNHSRNYINLNLDIKSTQPSLSLFPNNNNASKPIALNENEDNKIQGEKEEKAETEKKEKKTLGRKKKNSNDKGLHNKYSSDNIIRKIKTFLLKLLLGKINAYINEVLFKNIKNKNIKILKIKLNDIEKTENEQLLNQSLKTIFSNERNAMYKISNYKLSHNEDIISKLLKEEDKEKRKKFNDLFSLTFLDCLKHFRGDANFKQLEGLTTLKDVLSEFKDDPDYSRLFEHYVKNYEEEIRRKEEKKKKREKEERIREIL